VALQFELISGEWFEPIFESVFESPTQYRFHCLRLGLDRWIRVGFYGEVKECVLNGNGSFLFLFLLLCLSMMSHRWVREGYRGKWNLDCGEGTFGTCEGDNMRMGLSVIFLVVLILFVFTWFKIWITLVKKIKCPEHSLRILNIVKNIETYVLNVCKV
jgi:hypothetical protein